jgi:Rubisco Assembly chaperone C-terminal domain/Rubisco accumulation factor 1 alpha helical domain/Rubisco accumulation factor 1 helix turn helix domain
MTASSSSAPDPATSFSAPPDANVATQEVIDQLKTQLRRKEGNWVAWGQACNTLQKAGMSPQDIFEATGFEPIQQNQLIVASQVFESMVAGGVSDKAKAHYETRGSDSLYEFRILPKGDRAAAADFAYSNGLDSDQVKEIVKGLRDFTYSETPPPGFEKTMGDAAAYYYWRLARQQGDLQARSRLIAQSLRFVTSSSARSQIEKLLTDFSIVKEKPAPRLPIYRLEDEADSPVIMPVAGQMPLVTDDFKAVPGIEPEEPFGLVKFSGTGAWLPVPGWQVILKAEDPIALLTPCNLLPNPPDNIPPTDSLMVVVDRAKRDWDEFSYFVVDAGGQLEIRWFEEAPQIPLLGGVILIMRPKKILDQNYTHEYWQTDE